jgi:hypothetical protein
MRNGVLLAIAILASSAVALDGIPTLASRPDAKNTLYLDFDGHKMDKWGQYQDANATAFTMDDDPKTLSTQERSAIIDIWARVSEDYAPFQLNVTTIEPPAEQDDVARIVIGGNGKSWYGYRDRNNYWHAYQSGGVAYEKAFKLKKWPSVGWVFMDHLAVHAKRGEGWWAKAMAEAASHEAGHLFGLAHTPANGRTYDSGTKAAAPIMGASYYSLRTRWNRAINDENKDQDAIAVLADTLGLVDDDHGDTIERATAIVGTGGIEVNGIIGTHKDVDTFKFASMAGGQLSIKVEGLHRGGNLDPLVELRDSKGDVLQKAAAGETLSRTLDGGLYYLSVRGTAGYGDLGWYTLTGEVPCVTLDVYTVLRP